MGITARQFEQMQNRTRRSAAPVLEAITPARTHRVIIGIDPSLRGTGFGVLVVEKPAPKVLTCGTITCPAAWERSRCLARIFEVLRGVIREYQPTACAIEGLFFAQNLQTALIMGESRGASLVAAAEAGLEIYEIAPRKMKQAIVGYGAAQKDAVARMVQRMLNLPEQPEPDAADALALAIAYAQSCGPLSRASSRRI